MHHVLKSARPVVQSPGASSGDIGSAGDGGNVGVENPYSGGFSSLLPPLLSLEENPLAGIAATGLIQLPCGGASPATSPEWPQGLLLDNLH
jgi:hypothetical protein